MGLGRGSGVGLGVLDAKASLWAKELKLQLPQYSRDIFSEVNAFLLTKLRGRKGAGFNKFRRPTVEQAASGSGSGKPYLSSILGEPEVITFGIYKDNRTAMRLKIALP